MTKDRKFMLTLRKEGIADNAEAEITLSLKGAATCVINNTSELLKNNEHKKILEGIIATYAELCFGNPTKNENENNYHEVLDEARKVLKNAGIFNIFNNEEILEKQKKIGRKAYISGISAELKEKGVIGSIEIKPEDGSYKINGGILTKIYNALPGPKQDFLCSVTAVVSQSLYGIFNDENKYWEFMKNVGENFSIKKFGGQIKEIIKEDAEIKELLNKITKIKKDETEIIKAVSDRYLGKEPKDVTDGRIEPFRKIKQNEIDAEIEGYYVSRKDILDKKGFRRSDSQILKYYKNDTYTEKYKQGLLNEKLSSLQNIIIE